MRILLLLALGCGDPPPPVSLTLASRYEAVGVVRVYPDGLTPSSLDTFALTLSAIQISGGRAVGQVERRGVGSAPIPLSGTFDEEQGLAQFDPTTGPLTSSTSESIVINASAEDGVPEDDGVADDMTGFLRT